MSEYPKHITVDGIVVVVTDSQDEARWRGTSQSEADLQPPDDESAAAETPVYSAEATADEDAALTHPKSKSKKGRG